MVLDHEVCLGVTELPEAFADVPLLGEDGES